ncbi:Asp23/Gls24 family envelope stress response protein [Corynebacterium caspium]|uniref:Asp23/Gls24 family envelope stress response protein n=1 Tax=Corynebacterium caspium TaxID=234828 RepID=UPI000363B287|nr:Asp23/Gls24 family envelope stress response protein [Corynebacterium caspium]WKD59851.1 hypothetical protein CCASP_07360 [Corynebacterium caspium DSM 44850]
MTNAATGATIITEKALSRIVSAAAAAVPGTTNVGMSFDNPGGRSLPRFDVEIDAATSEVSVEAFIAATWPIPATTLAQRVRATISEWIVATTGLKIKQVNVYIASAIYKTGQTRITKEQLQVSPAAPIDNPVATHHHISEVKHPKIKRISASEYGVPVIAPESTKIKPFKVRDYMTYQEVKVAPQKPLHPIKATQPVAEIPISVKEDLPLRPIAVRHNERTIPVEILQQAPDIPIAVIPQTKEIPIRIRRTGYNSRNWTTGSGELN